MKPKFFIFLFLFFISLNFINAIEITAGESYSFEVQEQYDYYTIAGNSTTIELEVNQEGNNITIIPNKYLRNETFSIIFFRGDEITKEIHVGGGGGSRKTKIITKEKEIPVFINNETVVKENTDEEFKEVIDKANESLKREFWWKLGFAISFALFVLLISFLIKKKINNGTRSR